MLLAEAGVVALALFFHLRSRVAILRAFEDYDTKLPAAAALALSPHLIPSALAIAGGTTLLGLLLPIRRSQRLGLLGSGLLLASGALVFAIWAGFRAIFQPG